MAHVTLIRPTALVTKFGIEGGAVPPLGVAYVAAMLRTHGHDVACIDAPGEGIRALRICEADPNLLENGLSTEEIVARIPAETRVIGVSCMFSFDWFHVVELLRAIRARFPSQFIVLGGEHASADYDYILRNTPEVDACILGEGEAKMLALVQALQDGISKDKLPGVAILDSETRTVRKNIETDAQYRIPNIDSIPRPAWDLLPIASYLDAGIGYGSLHHRTMPMLASRGCPYRCTFCSSPQMWTTRWKARDIDDIISEIRFYVETYRVDRVEFYDLSVIIDKEWIIEFCQKLLDSKLGVTWAVPAGTRTEGLTKEVLLLIKKSGCSKLSYPIETGNPRISALIKKKINYQRSLMSMRNAVRAGIVVKTHIIIGFPFQTYGDVLIEFLFVIRLAWLGSRDVAFHTFAPYPGSELHNQLVADGTIVKDENYPRVLRKVFLSNYMDYQSWAPKISGRNLQRLSLMGMGTFYFFQFLFRPHRIFGTAYRVLAKKPVTMLELVLAKAVPRFLWRRRRVRLFGQQPESTV